MNVHHPDSEEFQIVYRITERLDLNSLLTIVMIFTLNISIRTTGFVSLASFTPSQTIGNNEKGLVYSFFHNKYQSWQDRKYGFWYYPGLYQELEIL